MSLFGRSQKQSLWAQSNIEREQTVGVLRVHLGMGGYLEPRGQKVVCDTGRRWHGQVQQTVKNACPGDIIVALCKGLVVWKHSWLAAPPTPPSSNYNQQWLMAKAAVLLLTTCVLSPTCCVTLAGTLVCCVVSAHVTGWRNITRGVSAASELAQQQKVQAARRSSVTGYRLLQEEYLPVCHCLSGCLTHGRGADGVSGRSKELPNVPVI